RDRAPAQNTKLPEPKFLTDHRRRYHYCKEQNADQKLRRFKIPPKKAGNRTHQQRRNRSPNQRNPEPPSPPASTRTDTRLPILTPVRPYAARVPSRAAPICFLSTADQHHPFLRCGKSIKQSQRSTY